MNFVYQKIIDSKNGDCLKCCVATLLGLEYDDVPNFIEHNHGDWLSSMREFLDRYNLMPVMLKRNEPLYQKIDYILIGKSPRSNSERSFSHAVIYNGNDMVHDPHPSSLGVENVNYVLLFQPIDFEIPRRLEKMIDRMSYDIYEMKNEISESNGIIRSSYQIASRGGRSTNWETYSNKLKETLKRQFDIMKKFKIRAN